MGFEPWSGAQLPTEEMTGKPATGKMKLYYLRLASWSKKLNLLLCETGGVCDHIENAQLVGF